MAGKSIDNLAITISANTNPLLQDLRKAARDIEQFSKTASRVRGPDGLPVVQQRRQGGVVAAPDRLGQAFHGFNRQRADAAAVAQGDRIRQDIAAAARENRMAREIAALRTRRETPDFMRGLTQYGQPVPPGIAARAGGALWGGAGAVAGFTGRGLAAGLGRVRDSAAGAAGGMLDFAKSIPPVAAGVATAELGLNGLAGAYYHLRDSIKLAADYEQQHVAFEVLLKDGEAARTMLADIRRFAASTPFRNDELADSARMLLAYGLAAEKVMPAVRMLGDVSAATGGKLDIRHASYLYGTLRAQGRAYARDILQFSNAGISINEELATVLGKRTFEISSLVEEGRVSFADVEKAFKNMTQEGGRFYNMTARQGQTAAASFELLADAIDVTKMAFGRALIEELDLKGASRDLQAFAARVRDGTNEVRPAIRFVGELGRGVAQLTYEFTRAGAAAASINLSAFERTFPGIGRAADSFSQFVKDAQQFKFDEEGLVDFGANAAEVVVRTFASIADVIAEGYRQAEAAAQPVLRTLERIDRLIPDPKRWAEDSGRFVGRGVPADQLFRAVGPVPPPAGRRDGDPIDPWALGPARPGMTADRVRAEWATLNRLVAYLDAEVTRLRPLAAGADPQRSPIPDHLRRLEEQQAVAHRLRWQFQGGHVGDPLEVQRQLDLGNVPPIRGGFGDPARGPVTREALFGAAVGGPAALFEPRERTFGESAVGIIRDLRETLKEDARRRREERESAESRELARFAALGPIAALPPFVPDARAVAAAQNRAAAWAGGVGPLAVAGIPDRTPEPRPEAMQLGIDLRRQYDPRQELADYRRDLDAVRLHQLAGPDSNAIADRAWQAKLRDVAGRFGIGGPVQLPSAVEAGTADDARLINTWRAARDQQALSEADLLKMILEQLKANDRTVRELPVAPAPRAVWELPGP